MFRIVYNAGVIINSCAGCTIFKVCNLTTYNTDIIYLCIHNDIYLYRSVWPLAVSDPTHKRQISVYIPSIRPFQGFVVIQLCLCRFLITAMGCTAVCSLAVASAYCINFLYLYLYTLYLKPRVGSYVFM